MKSAIVVGYQGIGKSSVASKREGFIDLESSCFYIDDVRPDNWYIAYVQVAIELAGQGNVVFMSSHKCVRDELYRIFTTYGLTIPLVIVHPDQSLRWEWTDRLYWRYRSIPSDKNMKALINTIDKYTENINDLSFERSCFSKLVIRELPDNFDLYEFLYSNLKNIKI